MVLEDYIRFLMYQERSRSISKRYGSSFYKNVIEEEDNRKYFKM